MEDDRDFHNMSGADSVIGIQGFLIRKFKSSTKSWIISTTKTHGSDLERLV